MKHDKDEDITDIVTSEGEEGWFEKVLEKVKSKEISQTLHKSVIFHLEILHFRKYFDNQMNQLFNQKKCVETK